MVPFDEFANDRPDSNGRAAIDEPDTEACLLPSPHGRGGRVVLEAARHGGFPLPPARALRTLLTYHPDTPYKPVPFLHQSTRNLCHSGVHTLAGHFPDCDRSSVVLAHQRARPG